MKICGIVAEYNPFHNGHKRQFTEIRRALGNDTGIICIMSGNFVQRGMPAIFDKTLRAKAAVACGADLVLEMPIGTSLSSAEGFADGCVEILSPFCDYLSFGAENTEKLMETAQALLREDFPEHLRIHLDAGLSFPAARTKALADMGITADLSSPNNILGVEYCKAILKRNSAMQILPILRTGDYHDTVANIEEPSATSLRILLESNQDISDFVPSEALPYYKNAVIHEIGIAEKAILARLRTMTDAEFESLPFGSEGLWRKLMHNARSLSTLEEILAATKSKRYTRTRLDRMVMCSFLGITEEMMLGKPPYVRVLAFNDRGREILKKAKQTGVFLNAGEKSDHPYEDLEIRADALYALFSRNNYESPDMHRNRRVQFLKDL